MCLSEKKIKKKRKESLQEMHKQTQKVIQKGRNDINITIEL